ncbi:MAG: kelch repeat-containing protein [Pseudomonadota bacterium]
MTIELSRRTMALGLIAGASGVMLNDRSVAQTGSLKNASNWSTAPSLPIAVQEIYPVLFRGDIVVAGGFSPDDLEAEEGVTKRVFAWSPSQPNWRELAPLPSAIHHPYLLEREGLLYAIGGFKLAAEGDWAMQSSVWVYDPQTNQWNIGPAMPLPIGETVGASLNGNLHVMTGRRPSGAENASWRHHSDINAHLILKQGAEDWTTARPAPTARNSAASVVVGTNIHVIGGRTVSGGNVAVHEVYHTQTDEWTRLAPLPKAEKGPHGAGGLASAVLNDTIYVFGGEWFDEDGGGVYHQTWAYDIAKDEWTDEGEMPTPRHGLGAVALNGKIYTIGGAAGVSGEGTSRLVEVFTP